MMRPSRRVVLGGALGAAAIVAVAMATRGESTNAAAAPAAVARTRAASRPAAAMPETDVRLELLEQNRAALAESERNPFRFQARPAPPTRRPDATSAPTAAPPPPVAPPVPAGPPPIPLRFIGLVEAPGQTGRVAILSDGRGNVFHGREGDIVEGRYRVGRVNPDSLELSYIDGRGRQVIRLSGQ